MTDEEGTSPSSPSREARLEAALAEYYNSLDEGRKPDHAALLARYPDLRVDLEQIFESEAFVGRLEGRFREVGGAAPVLPLGAGGHLGDYRIVGEIAHGGMGVVYRAWQRSLGRTVALKVVLSGEFASEEERRRFRREAELAAALDHPNIVPVYQVGEEGGLCYLAMRLIDGKSLAEFDGPIENRQRVGARIVEILARAIHYAHQHGIVHRDLKPANVIIDGRGEPHIVDFGLARLQSHSASLTRTGMVLGTLRYMAPEQVSSEFVEAGPTVDVYGLGAILYQLLVGVPPFSANSSVVLLKQVLEEDPVHPAFHERTVPRDLVTICLKCLRKSPRSRYQTAAEVADELSRYLEGRPIHARPTGLFERAVKWVRRRPVVPAIGSLLVLALVAIAIQFSYERELRRHTLEAEREREIAEHRLYAADQAGDFEGILQKEYSPAREFLSRYAPGTQEERLRGFGWYLLWRLAHVEEATQALPESQNSWVTFTPDNRRVVVCAFHRIAFWDVADPAGAHTCDPALWLVPGKGRAEGLAFSPDGRWSAYVDAYHERAFVGYAGSSDHTFEIEAQFVAWSDDPEEVVTLAHDGRLRVTRLVPTQHTVKSFAASPPLPGGFAVSADGTVAAVVSAGGVLECWNLISGERYGPFAVGAVHSDCVGSWVAVSRVGKLVALGHPDGRVTLWESESGSHVRTLSAHSRAVRCVSFSPRAKRLASGGDDRSIYIWSLDDDREEEVLLGHDGAVSAVAFDHEGERLASTSSMDDLVKLWDVSRSRLGDALPSERVLTTKKVIRTLICAPTGRTVIVGEVYGSDTLHVLDLDTNGSLTTRHLKEFPAETLGAYYLGASSPRGDLVAALGEDHRLVIQDVVRRGDIVSIEDPVDVGGHGARVRALGFSPDAGYLGTGDADGRVKLWSRDAESRYQLVRELTGTCEGIDFVFSRDGRYLAMSCTEGRLFLCDLETLRMTVIPVADERGEIGAILYSPDSRLLAVAADEVVNIWRLDDEWGAGQGPTVLMRCTGHVAPVFSLAFTPDGRRLASGSADTTIKVWDMTVTPDDRKAIECLTLRGHEGVVTALAFTPDGRTLLSAGALQKVARGREKAEVRVWRGASEAEIR